MEVYQRFLLQTYTHVYELLRWLQMIESIIFNNLNCNTNWEKKSEVNTIIVARPRRRATICIALPWSHNLWWFAHCLGAINLIAMPVRRYCEAYSTYYVEQTSLQLFFVQINPTQIQINLCQIQINLCQIQVNLNQIQINLCQIVINLIQINLCQIQINLCQIQINLCQVQINLCQIQINQCQIQINPF